ncbi:hypothetical protein G6O67_004761 [Ophiocordyceps sinensis]|uniref:Uncharacterized protein n=1 Tax=Ophiocordyceps sinensis TaxID=72228 RepID=A0A8H4PQ40_9HYPO|nr:hypothetical protein G6O67_004761 [Ophiocordyceps sinensis]
MGIKGIYRELGAGRRVSLAKLAADSFDTSDRPLRIAIDVAIWLFQAQAAQGGTNPAVRTLFYRLARLLGTPVQPVFVFDGLKKPAFKRNKRSGRGDAVATAQAKRLIRLFGFAIHDAPGEAEAECALLQVHGIVDAVLSEDVDTIMFGCTKTLRNWSAESTSSKTPTHVSLYDVHDQAIAGLGLGREGMVLVALMSGGDYLPEGIPGCGVKVACEAAKAGFGRSLCRLKASDDGGMLAWRDSLIHELGTNENRHFRTKHKALVVPDDFPSLEVLRYYTHPVVSQQSGLDSVRVKLQRKQELHLDALREFARETFGWDFRIGAVKFIRVLSQALLVHHMCQQREDSQQYVKRISGRREHSSTDTTQLRMAYVPLEVVPIDLSKEVEENIPFSRDGLALNSDVEYEPPSAAVEDGQGLEAAAAGGKTFDVTKPELAWVLESVVRKTIPKVFQEWEAKPAKAARQPPAKKAAGGTRALKTLSAGQKMLEQYFPIGKGPSMAHTAAAGSKAPPFGSHGRFQPPSLRNNPFRSPSPRQENFASPQTDQRRFSSHRAQSARPLCLPRRQTLDLTLARLPLTLARRLHRNFRALPRAALLKG